MTEAPQANFLPNFLDASASLTPKRSNPMTDVIHLRLLRVARSISSWSASASATSMRPRDRPRYRACVDQGKRARPPRQRTCFLADFLPLFELFLGASASAPSALPPAAAAWRATRQRAAVRAEQRASCHAPALRLLPPPHRPRAIALPTPAVPALRRRRRLTQQARPARQLGAAPRCCTHRTPGAGRTRCSRRRGLARASPLPCNGPRSGSCVT